MSQPVVATVTFQTAEGLAVGDESLYTLPFGYRPARGFRAATRSFCRDFQIGTPVNIVIEIK